MPAVLYRTGQIVVTPWRKSNVAVIDNASTGHGHLPYAGPREVVVSAPARRRASTYSSCAASIDMLIAIALST
ncbi:MAG: hypothetical protein QM661_06000 [Solimonas sp.]